MSTEVFQLMCGLDQNELEVQIGLQCAPLLTGIKISNLLTVAAPLEQKVVQVFCKTDISYHVLYRSDRKTTFFLYRKGLLQEYLQQPEVGEMMKSFGYEERCIFKILEWVAVKYSLHMEARSGFPHEIGLLLGYPAEDVSGFIKNSGKNFLYTGYWKVYGSLTKSMEIFEGYDRARERVVRMIAKGAGIHDILKFHYINRQRYRRTI